MKFAGSFALFNRTVNGAARRAPRAGRGGPRDVQPSREPARPTGRDRLRRARRTGSSDDEGRADGFAEAQDTAKELERRER
jgi:hypothetical protein